MWLFFSITRDVLLSKGLLGTDEKSADGGGIQSQGRGQLFIAEIVTAEEEKFGAARVHGAEDEADAVLLFGGGMELFGRGSAANEAEELFVAGAAGLAAEFVESEADGDAVEPAFGVFDLCLRMAPKFEENFDGELFGAGVVADDASNDAGDARILGAEEGVEVELSLGGGDIGDGFDWCVHKGNDAWAGRIVTKVCGN
jgi:hypothetical protein